MNKRLIDSGASEAFNIGDRRPHEDGPPEDTLTCECRWDEETDTMDASHCEVPGHEAGRPDLDYLDVD